MKKPSIIFCMIFSLSFFQNVKSQVLEDSYYIGKEKYNILQTFYYLLTINDSIADLELYMVSKGQTSSYYFFKNENKMPFSEQFIIVESGSNYSFKDNTNNTLEINITQDIVLTGGGHKVILEKVAEIPKSYIKMKNESLYTFASYYPHLIMGYDKKFESKKEVKISSDLRNSDLLEKCGQLNYSEYKELLHKELEMIIKKE